ncbi:MAG: hypothetical protein C4334_13780 [Pyrinomonas sp.]|uniref:hypothetical protein n=1 Tax=Pyrinomonas sp. TaxID=2080306 RepID=UPI00332E1230
MKSGRGVAIFNDYYGQQIAVTFDNLNTLGFTSNFTLRFGTYNTTNRPGPLFTGFNQDVRSLPNVIIPGRLTFPRQTPADNGRRIESSFDEAIVAPIHYNWNVTFERELPKGLTVQASYIGRLGRNLLATRDVMALSNLVDPKSGTDWYTAAGALEILRSQGAPISSVRPIPWFENLLPANLNALLRDYYTAVYGDPIIPPGLSPTQSVYASVLLFNGNDWTTLQDDMERATGLSLFYQSQYGALSAFGSIAYSNYHAGTVSVRQRLGQTLTLDFNYTLSHSLDNASGLQTSGTYGTAFILNPIRPRDNYSSSDFDVRQIINVNSVWQLPVGRGRRFLSNANGFIEALLGGWQLSGIFRWNSGLPAPTPYDDSRWATNWNVQSNAVRIKPVTTCPTRGAAEPPKLFGCDPTGAYRSFRNARPGETGDRNVFRMPGYVSLDMGLAKSFTMPWSENHKLQIRWEVFNVTNTQHFGRLDTSRTGFGITLDPFNESPPSNWSNFTGIQGTPRIMQFGFRYSF